MHLWVTEVWTRSNSAATGTSERWLVLAPVSFSFSLITFHFVPDQQGNSGNFDPVYDTLAKMVKLADNDTEIESECGCVKPCDFINPVLVQEFSVRLPGLDINDTYKGKVFTKGVDNIIPFKVQECFSRFLVM